MQGSTLPRPTLDTRSSFLDPPACPILHADDAENADKGLGCFVSSSAAICTIREEKIKFVSRSIDEELADGQFEGIEHRASRNGPGGWIMSP